MTRLSALLPLVQGVAVFAALDRAARAAAAAGDRRGRGQVMADTLVERVTGQATAAAVSVEVQLVMTDQTLLDHGAGADEPARLVGGHGWLPAPLARDLVLGHGSGGSTYGHPCDPLTHDPLPAGASGSGTDGRPRDPLTHDPLTHDPLTHDAVPADASGSGTDGRLHDPVTHDPVPADSAGAGTEVSIGASPAARSIRRLFTDPAGRLVAVETHARRFTPAMAQLVRVRDDVCRTPWCDAPIRQIDHIHPDTDGGPTSITNARGLCAQCNLAAQASGTLSRYLAQADGSHLVVGISPMGRTSRSRPPDMPGARAPRPTPAVDFIWDGPLHHHAA